MAQLEELWPGVRVKHDRSSSTLANVAGTVAERTPGSYIDTSVPTEIAVWVEWDNPHRRQSLTPQWCGIQYLEVIR